MGRTVDAEGGGGPWVHTLVKGSLTAGKPEASGGEKEEALPSRGKGGAGGSCALCLWRPPLFV